MQDEQIQKLIDEVKKTTEEVKKIPALTSLERTSSSFLDKLVVYLKGNFIFTKIHNPKDISDPIVEAIKGKKETVFDTTPIVKAIQEKDYPQPLETISIREGEELKQGLSDIVTTLREEIGKLDKEVVVKNDLSSLFGLFKANSDKKDVLKALKAIEKRIPSISLPEIPDYSQELQDIADSLHVDISPITQKLQDIVDRLEDRTLEIPERFTEKDTIKVTIKGGGAGGAAFGFDGQIRNTKAQAINPMTEEKGEEIVQALENIEIPSPVGGATEAKQDDIIDAIQAGSGAVKWRYIRKDITDPTYKYILYGSEAGHVIRRKELSTGIIKQFIATETDDITIDGNWTNRASLTYSYTGIVSIPD